MAYTVIPTYGRDYKSKAEVQEAWDNNHDFRIQGIKDHGRAINKKDAEEFDVGPVKVRYNKLQRAMMVNE